MSQSNNIIQIEGLSKDYITYSRGDSFREAVKSLFVREKIVVQALKNISLSVERGSLVGLLGPNGAGKSTLMKILTGVMYPTSGEVDVMGYTPWRQRMKYVAHIGAVFGQKSQLLWDIPPVDAFRMNKEIYGIPDEIYRKRLWDLTDLFRVEDISRKPTRQLSLGERMKCEFIMALLHGPEIVFLDEPTIGLDIIAKASVRDCILEMNRQGVTFLLTTHDMEDVEKLAERVVVINKGELAFDGSLSELRKRLGDRKLVRVTTASPAPDLQLEALRLVTRTNEYEALYALEHPSDGLDALLMSLASVGGISDISILDPPIEEMIKVFYDEKGDD